MEVDVEIKMEVIMCEVSLLVLRSLWFLMSPVFFFVFFLNMKKRSQEVCVVFSVSHPMRFVCFT